ncbi:hypothetical protein GQR58_008387 [Nymphon striatum]|nr:hypothetical protein GQR58_008387 [Nymphon striatum]
MSTGTTFTAENVKVKTEKESNWGGIPPSVLREDILQSQQNPVTASNRDKIASLQRNTTDIIEESESYCSKTKEPPVDTKSYNGKFGWTKVNNIDLPFILRGDEHYVSVRMIELKLLKTYFETLPMELFTISRVNSEYVTAEEIALLNEINVRHCDCKFGKTSFSRFDLIVQVDAVKEMCEFLGNCHSVVIGESSNETLKFGILVVIGTKIPYVVSENSKWIPLKYIPSSNIMASAVQNTVNKWEMGYLKFCCHLAKLNDNLIDEETKLVRVQDITSVDGSTVQSEEINLSSFIDSAKMQNRSSQNNFLSNNFLINGQFSSNQNNNPLNARRNANINWPVTFSNNPENISQLLLGHQRHSPVAPASKSSSLTTYSPNSPLVAPSPQQLSPSIEPVSTPPYSHHLPHMSSVPHSNQAMMTAHVPSISTMNTSITNSIHQRPPVVTASGSYFYNSSQDSLQSGLVTGQNLSMCAPQESHRTKPHISLVNNNQRKRTHENGRTTHIDRSTSSSANQKIRNSEISSLSQSFLDFEEMNSPQTNYLRSSDSPSTAAPLPSVSSLKSRLTIPDPEHIDETLPAYTIFNVPIESTLLPAINTKPYAYSEGIMVPLSFVNLRLFPGISLSVCKQVFEQILLISLYTGNKYIDDVFRSQFPLQETKTTLVRLCDLKASYSQLKFVMREILKKMKAGNSSELLKQVISGNSQTSSQLQI